MYAVLLSSEKVLVLEDQFASPCPCPRTSSPCQVVLVLVLVIGQSDHAKSCPWPWTTKSSKIVKDFAFCKQSIMYDHVKSINSVTATMHEYTCVTYWCQILFSTYWYVSVSHSSLHVTQCCCPPGKFLSSRILEDQFTIVLVLCVLVLGPQVSLSGKARRPTVKKR